MTPLEAKIAVGRRRHEKLAKLRQSGCSEDFWEIRKFVSLVVGLILGNLWRILFRGRRHS
jgi:hypothetical protein